MNSIKTNVLTPADEENILSELQSRAFRVNNLIFYNLQETNSYEADLSAVLSPIKSSVSGFDVTGIRIRRIGKQLNNKVRPTVVIFRDSYDARTVLNNRLKISPPIKLSFDRTQEQQELYKRALAEIKERNASGENNLYIKYVNNIPTVLDRHDSISSNSKSKN